MSKGKTAKGTAIKPIEMRRCVVCRQSFQKSELVRVVKTAVGDISFDVTGKAKGRGAYVCQSPECLATLKKRRNFDRIFKAKVPTEVYDNIEAATKEIFRM